MRMSIGGLQLFEENFFRSEFEIKCDDRVAFLLVIQIWKIENAA